MGNLIASGLKWLVRGSSTSQTGFHNLSNDKPMSQLLVLQSESFFDHTRDNSTLDITKFVLWFCDVINK